MGHRLARDAALVVSGVQLHLHWLQRFAGHDGWRRSSGPGDSVAFHIFPHLSTRHAPWVVMVVMVVMVVAFVEDMCLR